ncbi:MAG TPA: hypothetical protein VJB16_00980 [archaeon]|nr:hypothetical protein [archaeon]
MVMEFWNDRATDASWAVLLRLRAALAQAGGFTLIGGWAVYLWTKALKSKDIDVVVDYPALEQLRQLGLKKNPALKKYEIAMDDISVDIYVPFYSQLAIPPEELGKHTASREGFTVPRPEALILLKQRAAHARAHSAKGEKDRVDILSLLLHAQFDTDRYHSLSLRWQPEALRQLTSLIRTSKAEWRYLGIADPGKVKREKARLLALVEP